MYLPLWISRKFSAARTSEQSQLRRVVHRRSLHLQTLEDRCTPAIIVNSLDDYDPSVVTPDFGDTEVTLREAIAQAEANMDTIIEFDSSLFTDANGAPQAGTITLVSSLEIDVSGYLGSSLQITGAPDGLLTIDGQGLYQHFVLLENIDPGSVSSFFLGEMVLANGSGSEGGSIHSEVDQLQLQNVVFSSNSAADGGAIWIADGQTLFAVDTTFDSNSATGDGGAIHVGNSSYIFLERVTLSNNDAQGNGGAIDVAFAMVESFNVTFSGNRANGSGGAVYAFATILGDQIYINNTIYGNTADADASGDGVGGGLFVNANVVLENTMVLGNELGDSTPSDISGLVGASSNNLIGDPNSAGGLIAGENGNIVGDGSDVLDPTTVIDINLANNGGFTQTHAMATGSQAIDAGNNVTVGMFNITTDQLGESRIDPSGTVDIGAIEYEGPRLLSVEYYGNAAVQPNEVVTYQLTFDREVLGLLDTSLALFDQDGLAVAGTITNLQTSDSITYTVDITLPVEGTVVVGLGDLTGVTDSLGRPAEISRTAVTTASDFVTFDSTPPAAPVFAADPFEQANGSLELTGTSSEGGLFIQFTMLDPDGVNVDLGFNNYTYSDMTDFSWSYTPPLYLSPGLYTVTATATDLAGNVSTAGATSLQVLLGTPVFAGGDNPVNINTQTGIEISGSADPSVSINYLLLDSEGNLIAEVPDAVVADISGNWVLQIDVPSDGQYYLAVFASDSDGNFSAPTDPLEINVDSTPPDVEFASGLFDRDTNTFVVTLITTDPQGYFSGLDLSTITKPSADFVLTYLSDDASSVTFTITPPLEFNGVATFGLPADIFEDDFGNQSVGLSIDIDFTLLEVVVNPDGTLPNDPTAPISGSAVLIEADSSVTADVIRQQASPLEVDGELIVDVAGKDVVLDNVNNQITGDLNLVNVKNFTLVSAGDVTITELDVSGIIKLDIDGTLTVSEEVALILRTGSSVKATRVVVLGSVGGDATIEADVELADGSTFGGQSGVSTITILGNLDIGKATAIIDLISRYESGHDSVVVEGAVTVDASAAVELRLNGYDSFMGDQIELIKASQGISVVGSDPSGPLALPITVNGITFAFSNAGNVLVAKVVAKPAATPLSFVEQLYWDVLGRAGDAAGIQHWNQKLASGQMSRSEIAQAFVESVEHRRIQVTTIYQQYLHRNPDATGLANWVNALMSGQTEVEVVSRIMLSAEYFKTHGGTATGFVTGLYQDLLGRNPDAAGLRNWLQVFENEGAEAVVRGLFQSREQWHYHLDQAYEFLLRRDIDMTGRNTWTEALSEGMDPDDLIATIMGSAEYYSKV